MIIKKDQLIISEDNYFSYINLNQNIRIETGCMEINKAFYNLCNFCLYIEKYRVVYSELFFKEN